MLCWENTMRAPYRSFYRPIIKQGLRICLWGWIATALFMSTGAWAGRGNDISSGSGLHDRLGGFLATAAYALGRTFMPMIVGSGGGEPEDDDGDPQPSALEAEEQPQGPLPVTLEAERAIDEMKPGEEAENEELTAAEFWQRYVAALEQGDDAMAIVWIERNPRYVALPNRNCPRRYGVLAYAIDYRRAAVLERALQLGAWVDAPVGIVGHADIQTVLGLAIQRAWLEGVCLLVKHGAALNNVYGRARWNAIKYAQNLVDQAASRSNNRFDLHALERLQAARTILTFLQKHADRKLRQQRRVAQLAQERFEQAYRAHDWDALRADALGSDTFLCEPVGQRLWGRWLTNGRRQLRQILGTELNEYVGDTGLTPLVHALQQRAPDWALWLLEAGANPNQAVENGRLPFMFALRLQDPQLWNALRRHGADVNGRSRYGTVLHEAALLANRDAVDYLLEAGADCRQADARGRTPLQRLYHLRFPGEGHLAIMERLRAERSAHYMGQNDVELPHEIWLRIIQYLVDDPQALGAMNRVCWNAHVLVQHVRRQYLKRLIHKPLGGRSCALVFRDLRAVAPYLFARHEMTPERSLMNYWQLRQNADRALWESAFHSPELLQLLWHLVGPGRQIGFFKNCFGLCVYKQDMPMHPIIYQVFAEAAVMSQEGVLDVGATMKRVLEMEPGRVCDRETLRQSLEHIYRMFARSFKYNLWQLLDEFEVLLSSENPEFLYGIIDLLEHHLSGKTLQPRLFYRMVKLMHTTASKKHPEVLRRMQRLCDQCAQELSNEITRVEGTYFIEDVNLYLEFLRMGHRLKFDRKGPNPLHLFAWRGCLEGVQYCVQTMQLPVDSGDLDCYTALMNAAFQGSLDIVDYLLKRGAQVNALDSYGRSAVFYAAQQGHYEVMLLLEQHGADLLIKDKDGVDITSAAIFHQGSALFHDDKLSGHARIIHYLLMKDIQPTGLKIIQAREERARLAAMAAEWDDDDS